MTEENARKKKNRIKWNKTNKPTVNKARICGPKSKLNYLLISLFRTHTGTVWTKNANNYINEDSDSSIPGMTISI